MTRFVRVIIASGVAIAVAPAEVRKGGSVRAVWAGIIIGRMAGIVARLEAVEARIAVVGALIQDRRDRRDAGSSASFTILLSGYFYDHRGLTGATGEHKIGS